MSLTRRFLLLGPAAACFANAVVRLAAAADPAAAASLIQRFYDDLLAVMKQAKKLSFTDRYNRLAPAITRTFNLALMSRIAVGPEWAKFTPEQQQRVADSFSRYTISLYTNRFDDYGGERFEVTPTPQTNASGVIVQTQLIKTNGEKISLNYLMRQAGEAWQVIDVFLSGTVSELAARRSEFTAVLAQGGADALVRMLDQRTAVLRTG